MVSVIIPTYKRAKAIFETIKSVLNQDYSDFEVLVISDGPGEDTRKVIEGFGDARIKYYEIEHSGRPAVPRNFGIDKARGEYIAFCDDDDIWLPDKLRLQMDKISEDKEIGLVYTQCLLKNGKQERVIPHKGKQGFIFKELFLSYCFIATSSVLVRREIVEAVGAFDEGPKLRIIEDFDLWLRAARACKIGFINKLLVVHKENENSISKGNWGHGRRQYRISRKLYKDGYVSLGLFLNKLARILCKSIIMAVYPS